VFLIIDLFLATLNTLDVWQKKHCLKIDEVAFNDPKIIHKINNELGFLCRLI